METEPQTQTKNTLNIQMEIREDGSVYTSPIDVPLANLHAVVVSLLSLSSNLIQGFVTDANNRASEGTKNVG